MNGRTEMRMVLAVLTACLSSPLAAEDAAPSQAAAAALSAEKAAVLAELWPLEQSIYAGRAAGDGNAYYSTTARGYLSWPPMTAAPIGAAPLRQSGGRGPSQEKIVLTFVDLALQGDVAIIYYSTHRTMAADGTPVDQRFEVTHTWVREDGAWKMLGGMGRAMPLR